MSDPVDKVDKRGRGRGMNAIAGFEKGQTGAIAAEQTAIEALAAISDDQDARLDALEAATGTTPPPPEPTPA